MSTATALSAIRSQDESDACRILVLSEDAPARDNARNVCFRLLTQLENETDLTFSFWLFTDLDHPVSAGCALEALNHADVALFSLRGSRLPPRVTQWLDACGPTRTKTEGALALLLNDQPVAGLAWDGLAARLQSAAQQLRMDFLPPMSGSPDLSLPPGRSQRR